MKNIKGKKEKRLVEMNVDTYFIKIMIFRPNAYFTKDFISFFRPTNNRNVLSITLNKP